MKRRYLLPVLLLITVFIINSCKKDGQSPIATLFTGGTWRLASVMAYNYVGNSQTSIDTLNNPCALDQFFTFQTDFTCTYTNYSCKAQPTSTGTWSLTPNQLFLQADMTCVDDTAGNIKPFINAQIQNLGQYSMILNTGDIEPNYSLTKHRRIFVYGFVREKSVTSN